jgi:hypothetical protein
MEILVRIDEDDKAKWQNVLFYYNSQNSEHLDTLVASRNATSDFWHDMIEKYPVLKNKRIAMNFTDGYIFSFSSYTEMYQYSS